MHFKTFANRFAKASYKGVNSANAEFWPPPRG